MTIAQLNQLTIQVYHWSKFIFINVHEGRLSSERWNSGLLICNNMSIAIANVSNAGSDINEIHSKGFKVFVAINLRRCYNRPNIEKDYVLAIILDFLKEKCTNCNDRGSQRFNQNRFRRFEENNRIYLILECTCTNLQIFNDKLTYFVGFTALVSSSCTLGWH